MKINIGDQDDKISSQEEVKVFFESSPFAVTSTILKSKSGKIALVKDAYSLIHTHSKSCLGIFTSKENAFYTMKSLSKFKENFLKVQKNSDIQILFSEEERVEIFLILMKYGAIRDCNLLLTKI
jgi:hypothetical protein